MSVGMRLPEAQKNSMLERRNPFQTGGFFFNNFLSSASLPVEVCEKYADAVARQRRDSAAAAAGSSPPSSCCDTALPVQLVRTFLSSFNSPLISF